jgi:hypothetical protein
MASRSPVTREVCDSQLDAGKPVNPLSEDEFTSTMRERKVEQGMLRYIHTHKYKEPGFQIYFRRP